MRVCGKDKLGRTPLHNAVAVGCDELAKGLIEEKALDLDHCQKQLLIRSGRGGREVLRVGCEADVNARTKDGKTAAHSLELLMLSLGFQ